MQPRCKVVGHFGFVLPAFSQGLILLDFSITMELSSLEFAHDK